ncbi:MAG: hypothetical protein FWC20_11830 [Oscillospiraceae bacterium]|nr:hypothetical protein [Oscillospiraceae bacterium]MCL2280073.1 hypothetical protein [Oscillospiraceae bacterium]
MIQSDFYVQGKYSPKVNTNIVHRLSFGTMGAWDRCALLAVFNHHLATSPNVSRGQSAHFWKSDCFECLSPHKSAA